MHGTSIYHHSIVSAKPIWNTLQKNTNAALEKFVSIFVQKYLPIIFYLKCELFRTHGCKGTGRSNRETDLITPLNQHNHPVEDYQTKVFELKTKCKNSAISTQINIRKVFDDTTRMDPSACNISFRECESSMYRARRTIEPKIPLTAIEFSDMLSTTSFGDHHKFTVRCGEQTGVVLFSDQMTTLLADISNV